MGRGMGRGVRIVSTKQVVGMGEERTDFGPWVVSRLLDERVGGLTKPSERLLQSCILIWMLKRGEP